MRLQLCTFILDSVMITMVIRSGPGAQGVPLAANRRRDRILRQLYAGTWRVRRLYRRLPVVFGFEMLPGNKRIQATCYCQHHGK